MSVSAATQPGGRLAQRRAWLSDYLQTSCPERYRSNVRIQTGVDQRSNPRAGKAGSALLKRQQMRADLARQPLRPRPYLLPKEMRQMSVTSLATATTELSPEQLADLRERVRIVAQDDPTYTQARIGREADISSATLSQFLGGTYAGNVQNVARKLLNWTKALDERTSAGRLPEGPEWVPTPTSEKILAGLRYAQMAGDVVLIVGGAGLGKSKTIQRYTKTAPNVWHVELTPATGSVMSCLQEIAIVLGLRDLTNSAAFLQRAIFQRVRDTNGLLVLDEAQHLSVPALDQVRAINDQTGVGLVLCGNERVYTQMSGGNRAPFLDRLYSRIGKKIVLKKATVADADAIIAAWGIDDSPCRDAIRQIAATPGALRVLNKVLRLAATYAKAQARSIGCNEIRHAAAELGVMV
ncbi:AAA family ATPase [Xanthomonas cucurbitae]|uniref:AAA family ATPase n=1 Tax=Xanthomonas cucurbitae TaxID=56453 RepID=A0ABY7YA65_9XANT|nr:AAA family ATPase [Xanthomonas cucurbitae]WDM66891.1 AAA family ATPase [Xanthomonas cucurbitae]WDM70768.1 AAA family ATPase [Xanthomonas cucurbitae]